MAPANHSSAFLLFPILCIFLSGLGPITADSGPFFACDVANNPGLANLSFCDLSLGLNARVKDLVSRLTLPEKFGWLGSGSRGVSRLGIPNYEWWSEALHGVSSTGPGTNFQGLVPGATSFPQVILTAATFNESLFEIIGKVVSTEARAMYNVGSSGLTFWSPNVNIFRDPRWGRGQETPGEDPFLASKYAVAYVRGLQETDSGSKNRLKVAACCKHYTAYDLDNWKGVHRFTFNAEVTPQDLEDTYQPPFKSCVLDGRVASVMCSYNQVNGKPTCGDPDLLDGVIRKQWKLKGYIVSDCDSLDVMLNSQHYTKTPEEAAALSVKSGLDLNCGSSLGNSAQAAIDRGLLTENDINTAISHNFATMMRLGFFDGNPRNRMYGNLGPADVCTPSNQELAREVARQGIVLLKNTAGSLPLSPSAVKSLAVIGPNADVTHTMIGNYEGTPCNYMTTLQGLSASVPTAYHKGCSDTWCGSADLDGAKEIASKADAVVLVMGSDQSIESEDVDRVDIGLPGQQQLLVSEVASVSHGPVILVIMSGGGMDVQFAKDDPKITSILWVGFPGQAGGAAIADVIFGHHNPSGKLPMTWYPRSYVDNVRMADMNMRADPATGYPGRTYRFYKGPVVYSFGDGISYTQFSHELVKAPTLVAVPLGEKHECRLSNKCESVDAVEEACESLGFGIHVKVKNEGGFHGGETVLLFLSFPEVHGAPRKQLLGFEKVRLGPREEGVVKFEVDVCRHLSVVDESGNRKLALGNHTIHVGSLMHYLIVGI